MSSKKIIKHIVLASLIACSLYGDCVQQSPYIIYAANDDGFVVEFDENQGTINSDSANDTSETNEVLDDSINEEEIEIIEDSESIVDDNEKEEQGSIVDGSILRNYYKLLIMFLVAFCCLVVVFIIIRRIRFR